MEYMSKQDVVDLAFYGEPAQEFNCYTLIGEIAERVVRFNDHNEPTAWSQRYVISFGICADTVSIIIMDLLDPTASKVTMAVMYARTDDAIALNEILEMVIYLAKELTV
jgi:hypothetical protein